MNQTSGLGQKQTLNNFEILSSEWLLLGEADSSKVVNLMNMSGCFRPEAVIKLSPFSESHQEYAMSALERKQTS
jgi:hypothetical protein